MYITQCRVCKSKDVHKFLDFGMQPAADAFLKKEQLNEKEPKYPLEVWFCNACGHVQLGYIAARKPLFESFTYLSSVSKTMRDNFQNIAEEAVKSFDLGKDSLVIDIGCNDGALLKSFRSFGTRVLGIDPSPTVKFAIADGVDVINDFFYDKTADAVLKYGKASIVTGTNVFAHIDDYDSFLNGLNIIMEDVGVMIWVFLYLVDTLNKMEFDTMYHEHLSYFSIKPLIALFKRFDMELFDVKKNPIHGGSIRIFVKKSIGKWKVNHTIIKELLELERSMKLDSLDTYIDFANRVNKVMEDFVNLLKGLKAQGKKIVGNGAPAKGNALLNFCSIGPDIIDYLAEINHLKQGLYNPGMHIPVVPLEQMHKDNPDYMVILPWNIKDDIIKQEQEFKQRGGKFIIPIPSPTIL